MCKSIINNFRKGMVAVAKMLKKVVLVVALTFFLVQMIAALNKYFNPQVISSPGVKAVKTSRTQALL